MTTENPREAADVGRRATNSPPMDPEPTPTLIGRLDEQERHVVDALLACLPMHEDGTGHVADCGYDWDATPTCGCYTLPDRLAAVVRTHAERAWDEGYRSGHSNAMRRMSDEPNAPTTLNPYRQEADR